jgi:hypothetical protein
MKLCECGCGKPAPIAKRNRRAEFTKGYAYVKGEALRFLRGHCKGNLRHGMSDSSEYGTYCTAIQRCTNPNNQKWPDYGGRDIKFLFTSFEQFFAELGPRPDGLEVDRINNNGNYEPGNVRWATPKQQKENQRERRR